MSPGESFRYKLFNEGGKLKVEKAVIPGGVNKVRILEPEKSGSAARPDNPLKSASRRRGGRPLIDVRLGAKINVLKFNPVNPDKSGKLVRFVNLEKSKVVSVDGKLGKVVIPVKGTKVVKLNPDNEGKLTSPAENVTSNVFNVDGKLGKDKTPGGVYRPVNPVPDNGGKLVIFDECRPSKKVNVDGKLGNVVSPVDVVNDDS